MALFDNRIDPVSAARDAGGKAVPSHRIARYCAGVITAALAHAAVAQTISPDAASDTLVEPVAVVAGVEASRDSNVYRSPSFSGGTIADTITAAYVGLRIDTLYSLQAIKLDVTETTTRYDRASQLDFNSLNYRGLWLWQVSSRLSGSVRADRIESLIPFQDILAVGTTSRNLSVNQTQAFSLDAWAIGDWHALLAASHNSQKSEQVVQINPDFHAISREAGVKYSAPSGTSLSLVRRVTDGEYVNEIDSDVLGTGYVQQETELTASVLPSPQSTLSARLTRIAREQTSAEQRNYSGLTGALTYTWVPTGKLRIDFSARRDIDPFQDPSATHIVSDTYSIAPVWKISAMTRVHLRVSRTRSDFTGPAVAAASLPVAFPVSPQAAPRTDNAEAAELGASWTPARSITVGALVQRQVRLSTIPLYGYNDTIVKLTAQFKF